ncbi:MAG: phosphomannomutase/phosphoglucomutase, partial [Phycicoccus sp.]
MTSRSLADVVKAYDVRGTVPDQLDVDVAHALGVGFAEVVVRADDRRGCVVARDMRDSGPQLVAAFAGGLRSRGVDVTDIGLTSTDGLYHASGLLDLPGAMFTASHNPAAYNGIKLCRSGARPVGQDTGLAEVRSLAELVLADDADLAAVPPGTPTERDTLADYAGYLRGLVDVTGIRPLTVVVDAGNGRAGHPVPAVLGTAAGLPALPLTVVPMYFELDGTFPNHEANPLDPTTLVDLQAAVCERGADLGLAFDGDADR